MKQIYHRITSYTLFNLSYYFWNEYVGFFDSGATSLDCINTFLKIYCDDTFAKYTNYPGMSIACIVLESRFATGLYVCVVYR